MSVADKLLLQSSGAWRFPVLATTTANGTIASADREARSLARDLAAAWQPDEAVAWLIEQGEFGVAEDMIDLLEIDGVATSEQAEHMRAGLYQARNAVVEIMAARRRQLGVRCDRCAVAHPRDLLTPVVDIVRVADAEQDFAVLEEEVERAENRAVGEVRERLEELRSSLSPARARHVEDLLDSGECLLARRAIEPHHTHDVSVLIPLYHRERPWLWRSQSRRQILAMLRSPELWLSGMGHFAPGEEDQPGHALLTAIEALDEESVAAWAGYLDAVQRMIGPVDVAPRVEERDGVLYSRLVLPDDPRLPRLKFVGRDPVPFVLGETPVASVFRLSPRVDETLVAKDIVVDIASMLSLLAKDDAGRARGPEPRRLSLLRLLCTQLEVRDVVEPSALAFADLDDLRPRLWWLLYLLGHTVSPATLDGVLEVSGGHAHAVLAVVEAGARLARAQKTEFDLGALRAEDGFDDALYTAVRADLPDTAFVLLMTMTCFGVTDETGLREGVLTLIAETRSKVSVDAIIDIDRSLAVLHEKGYLPHWTADYPDYRFCGCGVTRSLMRTERLGEAQEAVDRLVAAHTSSISNIGMDSLYRKALEDLLHLWDGDKRERASDPRTDVAANREVRRNLADWVREEPLDLYAECHKVWRHMRDRSDRVDVIFDATDEAKTLTVLGAPLALRIAFENLINNAVRAARSNVVDSEFGTVEISLSVDAERDVAVIDIADSGAGVAEPVAASLSRDEVPDSTEHSGKGEGLAGARHWIEDMKGTLRLVPQPAALLGGAHFRVTLPLQSGGSGR